MGSVGKIGLIIAFFLVLSGAAQAVDCFCATCDECEVQLNNQSCTIVYLTDDVIDHTWTCIDDPENFSNKVFDCQGHTLDGIKATSYAVDATYKINITIRNCVLTEWHRGIYLRYSNHSTFENNVLIEDTDDGIYIGYSSYNNIVINNTVTAGGVGILVDCPFPYLCRGNTILNNTVRSNGGWGIYIYYANATLIANNSVENNTRGIGIGDFSNNNTVIGNTVNDNQQHGIDIDSDATNNTLESNTICFNNQTDSGIAWYDVFDTDPHLDDNNLGNNNTCDTTYNYNDTGAVGCTLSCTAEVSTTCYCSTCDECEVQLNNQSCTIVYLTADITGQAVTCINNPANINDTIFDCQGHSIEGTGANAGITTTSKGNLTVRNCVIQNFATGIYNYYGDYCSYINNTFYNMSSTCMYISGNSGDRTVEYNLITGNTINGSFRGIRLIDDCRDNIIEDNVITYNTQQG
ncbi:MAG: right-handed parallel beta-helix repeat-containing protein, partial [Candidatus Altiarchaeota archaeon]